MRVVRQQACSAAVRRRKVGALVRVSIGLMFCACGAKADVESGTMTETAAGAMVAAGGPAGDSGERGGSGERGDGGERDDQARQMSAASKTGALAAGSAAAMSTGGSGGVRATGTAPSASGAGAAPALDASQPPGAAGASAGTGAATTSSAGTGATASAGSAASPPPSTAAAIPKPNELHGVNWADKRDNFVHGLLQLSGLDSSTDTYDSVRTKTATVVAQFREQLGANTIRIPINELTVSSPWWNAYKAVIDTTTEMGMNVIVAYWAYTGGKPDDEAAFKAMWQTVVSAYPDNNRVLFDIHNEPSGFSTSAWKDEAARWLSYFPSIPRGRVIVAGTGSDTDVVPLGSDARFDGCMLQLHYYAFWHKDWTQQKQWRDAVTKALGSYASRTFVGEWGADMASGLDYDTKTPDGNSEIAYITAMADLIREHEMGSCYWPGLRDGDSYALMKRDPNDSALELSVVNPSGRDRLRWSWNY